MPLLAPVTTASLVMACLLRVGTALGSMAIHVASACASRRAVRGIQGGAAVVLAALAAALPGHHDVLLADGGERRDLGGHGAEHHRSPGDARRPSRRGSPARPTPSRGRRPSPGPTPRHTRRRPRRPGPAGAAGRRRARARCRTRSRWGTGGRPGPRSPRPPPWPSANDTGAGMPAGVQARRGRRLATGCSPSSDLDGAPSVGSPVATCQLAVERGRACAAAR